MNRQEARNRWTSLRKRAISFGLPHCEEQHCAKRLPATGNTVGTNMRSGEGSVRKTSSPGELLLGALSNAWPSSMRATQRRSLVAGLLLSSTFVRKVTDNIYTGAGFNVPKWAKNPRQLSRTEDSYFQTFVTYNLAAKSSVMQLSYHTPLSLYTDCRMFFRLLYVMNAPK